MIALLLLLASSGTVSTVSRSVLPQGRRFPQPWKGPVLRQPIAPVRWWSPDYLLSFVRMQRIPAPPPQVSDVITGHNHDCDFLQLSILQENLFLNALVSGAASLPVVGFCVLNSPRRSPACGWGLGWVLEAAGGSSCILEETWLPGVFCPSATAGPLAQGLLDESRALAARRYGCGAFQCSKHRLL